MRAFLQSHGTKSAAIASGFLVLYTAVVTLALQEIELLDRPRTEAVLAIGTGLLLGLRLNRAYERWWEARTLWGALVNVSRNLAVKSVVFAAPDAEEARSMAGLIAGFAQALKGHLRGGVSLASIRGFEDTEADPQHVPLWLATRIYEQIRAWNEEGRISDEQMRTLDLEARELLEITGACERIHNTPMPPSLSGLTVLVLTLTLLGLPWVLHDDGPAAWVILAVGMTSFFLLVIETTASVIERPFGTDSNQLDLDGLCAGICASVNQSFGVS